MFFFKKVVVDAEGDVQDVQLNAPFAYLASLKELTSSGIASDQNQGSMSEYLSMSFADRGYATELQTLSQDTVG